MKISRKNITRNLHLFVTFFAINIKRSFAQIIITAKKAASRKKEFYGVKNTLKNKRFLIKSISVLLLLITAISCLAVIPASAGGEESEKKTVISSRFYELLFSKDKNENKNTNNIKSSNENRIMLSPSGDVFGVKISGSGVRVSRVLTEVDNYPLEKEDKIERIDGINVYSVSDVKRELSKKCESERIKLDIIRGAKRMSVSLPLTKESGEIKLGVLLSDSAAGIGTVTYIDPKSGDFGGLGHGICDIDSGSVLPLSGGEATGVILGGATRGESGKPGELRGILTHETLGEVNKNTAVGVFGRFNDTGIQKKCHSEAIEVAHKEEVTPGEAEIISTVKSGKRASYKIEITDIDYSSEGSKSFKIKVTDDTLAALTGGIVRGMSGSPIIQNGRLIGAVTHVMISDPKEGYGIFIENMLAESGVSLPKAA